jgi:hypothetical protein
VIKISTGEHREVADNPGVSRQKELLVNLTSKLRSEGLARKT